MKIKIYKDDSAYLRKKSIPLPLPISDKYRKLLLAMIDYLKKSQDEQYASKHQIREGVGLAAPQVGHNVRMLAIYFEKDGHLFEHGLVNPVIISSSVKLTYLPNGEGCLSVDEEHLGYVFRHQKVVVKAYDIIPDKQVELTFRGFEAIVLQHEIDHLNGILFYDRIDKNEPFKIVANAEVLQS